ncbi:MAG: DUF309 domain-containing protein [Candidatus Caenarcaniphilales bacterium]|nr:DUF309 domain-containing protein [Candidatus Caenarcaniphilales bacterium]
MLDDEQQDLLKQGIDLFNQGEFFEAHEFFEVLWQQSLEDSDREQFLFCVRISAAGVHLSNESFSSLFLFQLAQKQLEKGLNITFLDASCLDEQLQKLINLIEKSQRSELKQISKKTNLELKPLDYKEF